MTAQELSVQPAYPTKEPALDPREVGFFTRAGLTKREEFAARAMQGLVASEDENNGFADVHLDPEGKETFAKEHWVHGTAAGRAPNKLLRTADEQLVQRAVKLADLLLAELAKEQAS